MKLLKRSLLKSGSAMVWLSLWCFVLLASGTWAGAPQSQRSADMSALSTGLPSSWRQFRQREPTFGADVFWVEVGKVDQPPVLLVHGLGQSGLVSLAPVITRLSRDYHVIALDLPGFGLSAKPSGRYTPTNYARVLRWLVDELGVRPVSVFGHSMGGAVALRFAASNPKMVERLVLVNTAGILQRTAFLHHVASLPMEIDGAPASLAAGADTLRLLGRYLVDWSNLLPNTGTLLQSDSWIWKTFVDGQPNINAALSLVEEDFSAAIDGLEVDTYIISGTNDPLAPPRTGRLLAGSLPRAELLEMLGADHIPMHTQPELFTALLLQALQADGVGAPYWQRPKRVWRAPDLVCDRQHGQRYSGYYKRVEIRDCNEVLLENVSAESLLIVRSAVQAYNLELRSSRKVAITLEQSELELTNAEIVAGTAVASRDSRVDFAGVKLRVGEHAVVGSGENKLVLSVSELLSPSYDGYVHGSYELTDTSLDVQLP